MLYSFLVDVIGKELNKLFSCIFIAVVCEQLIIRWKWDELDSFLVMKREGSISLIGKC